MLKGYEYRMQPTEDQEVLLSKHLGSCRWFYNFALNKKIQHYAVAKKTLSRFELQELLPTLKKDAATCWLKEVNSQSLQATLINLDKAYEKFFKKTGGFPKFKSKKDSRQSFLVPQKVLVNFDKQELDIPKFKTPLKLRVHRKFKGDIRSATVKRSPTGKWFVSILVEDGVVVPDTQPVEVAKAVGIDLGIKTFAVLSDGKEIANPRFLKNGLPQLKKAQRSFARKLRMHKASKKVEWSKNLEDAKKKVATLHEQVANQRKDFLHRMSSEIACDNQTVCLEDLNVSGMVKNYKLARHIQDCAWGMMGTMLEYKLKERGHNLLTIGRFEPSSKVHNECGWMKKDLKLSDREWVCEGCGCVVDRDLNAALNIRDFALRDYFAPEDKGSEPEIGTLRKEVAQEKECAIRAEAPSL
jgi:putative transposase